MTIVGIDHVQLAMPADREEEAREFYSVLLGIHPIGDVARLVRWNTSESSPSVQRAIRGG